MNIKRWFLNNSIRNYQYLLHDDKHAIVIDPLKFDVFDDFISEHELHLTAILITHKHGDHIAGVKKLLKKYPEAKTYAFMDNELFKPDFYVKDDAVDLGFTRFTVIHTPGHISDHVCFIFDEEKAIFCGDTVFNAGVGGVQDGTANIEHLGESIEKIMKLNQELKLYPAHDYWRSNLEFALSVLPNDLIIEHYLANVADMPAEDKPILTIQEESKCNVFMRSFYDKSLNIMLPEYKLGMDMFVKLRHLKNNF